MAVTKSDPTIGDLEKQIGVLRDDISQLTTIITDLGRSQTSHLRAMANDKVAELRGKGADAAEAARHRAEVAYSDAEAAIRANPAAAVGIAAGVGFLVGLLTSRR